MLPTVFTHTILIGRANSVDPDQTASCCLNKTPRKYHSDFCPEKCLLLPLLYIFKSLILDTRYQIKRTVTRMQSDLGPLCLQYRLSRYISR